MLKRDKIEQCQSDLRNKHMRTNEHLYLLQNNFDEDLKIEINEVETSWGTTYYEAHIWLESELLKELSKEDPKRMKEYEEGGIASCFDLDCVTTEEELDKAIETFFYYCHDQGLLD